MKARIFDISEYSFSDIRNAIAAIYNKKLKTKEICGFKVAPKKVSSWDISQPKGFSMKDELPEELVQLLKKEFEAKKKKQIKSCDDIIKKCTIVLYDNKMFKAIMENSDSMFYCQVESDLRKLYDRVAVKSNAHYNLKYKARHREQADISC